jgi:hypothetical protein
LWSGRGCELVCFRANHGGEGTLLPIKPITRLPGMAWALSLSNTSVPSWTTVLPW